MIRLKPAQDDQLANLKAAKREALASFKYAGQTWQADTASVAAVTGRAGMVHDSDTVVWLDAANKAHNMAGDEFKAFARAMAKYADGVMADYARARSVIDADGVVDMKAWRQPDGDI